MVRQYASRGRDQINIEHVRNFSIQQIRQAGKSTKSYIVGLDLGDGESCFSYVNADSQLEADRPIFPLNGREIIPSAIAESGEEVILIGDEAFVRPDAIELEINFKYDPVKEKPRWEKRRDKILLFVKKYVEEFYQNHSTIADNCEIFIGCPSGWSEASRKIYEQHLNNEDLPTCHVVPESRAALIQALDLSTKFKDKSERLRKLIRKKVLLIDIGSSTTDVTILDNLEPYEIQIGGDLGLKLVDQQLVETVYKTHPENKKLKAHVEGDRRDERFLLYLCRLAKEYTFGRNVDPTRFLSHRKWAKDCWKFLLSLDLADCLSDQLFWENKESWIDRYRSLLQKVQSLPLVNEPDMIIVTGGGSNIQQLLDETSEAFPYAFSDCCPEPSLSVARGLAGYGQWLKNVGRFYNDANKLIQEPRLESEISSESSAFMVEVVRQLAESSVEAIWQPMAYKWKDEKLNLHDQGGLTTYVLELYRKWLNDGNNYLFEPALNRLSDAANRALQNDIKKLGIRYGLPVGNFKIELQLLPTTFFTPNSPGGSLLSTVAKAFQVYEDVGFQLIDRVPNWLRKIAYSSGALDLALESEKLIKRVLASVVAPWFKTGVSPEIQERIIDFVRDEAKEELNKQLNIIGKLLLETHRSFGEN